MHQVGLTATPNLDPQGRVEWTLSDGKASGKKGHFPSAHVPQGDSAKFTITIANPAGMNIEFSSDPLWVVQGTTCPSSFSSVPDQITNINPTGKRLTFIDHNVGNGPLTLMYRLNFVDANNGNAPVTDLDPEIRNTGGGLIQKEWLSGGAILGIAVVAIGLAALAALFLPRR